MTITAQQRSDLYKLGVGMYDAAVGAHYMDLLGGLFENGVSIDQLYEGLANDPSFQSLNFGFTEAATNAQFATAFVDQLTGGLLSDGGTLSEDNHDVATDFIEALLELPGMSRGAVMKIAVDALDAISHDDESFGAAAARFDNKVEVSRHYTEILSGSAVTVATLQSTIASVDETSASVEAAKKPNAHDASLFPQSTFAALAKTGPLAGDVTVINLAGTKIVVDDTSASADGFTLTATLADDTGTSDSAEINFNGDGGSTMANFTTAGLESIAIDSQSENDGDVNAITVITTTDNVLSSITITGAKDFMLGGVSTNSSATTAAADVASALTAIDGSTATGDLTVTAGFSTFIGATAFKTTYDSLNIKTGEGDDSVDLGGRGTVSTGAGADDVTVRALGVNVDVGADEDTDVVSLLASAHFDTAFDPTTRVTTIGNLAEGDEIDFFAIENAATTVHDFTVTAGTFASLETAVNAAIADATSAVDFFNWVDDNTYIVVDGGSGDTVIELTGTYEDFTLAAGVVTIG